MEYSDIIEAMIEKHPTYTNPTISEALCEIHFRLPSGPDWRATLFGAVFKQIQNEFPSIEPITRIGLQWEASSDGLRQSLVPVQHRMRYKHASKNLLLQLSTNILVVNVLSPYPGWTQMSTDIQNAWVKICEVVQPESITRVGLRYINRIERSREEDTLGDWLASNEYIPQAILTSLPGFLSRLEIYKDIHNKLVVTVGETPGDSDQIYRAIVLDIDRTVEGEIRVDREAIAVELDELHDDVWDVFKASITSRLEQVLQGKDKDHE